MQPDEDKDKRVGTLPVSANRSDIATRAVVPERNVQLQNERAAAANVVRGHLHSIYDGNSGQNTPHTTPVESTQPQTATASQQTRYGAQPVAKQVETQEETNPYDRTYNQAVPSQASQDQAAKQWEHYHSAWQQYYQQYYERYYVGEVQRAQSVLQEQITKQQSQTSSHQPAAVTPAYEDDVFSKNQALAEIRGSIQQKIATAGKKVRGSRHFIPISAAVVVLMLFGFLQYNRLIFGTVAAYVSPGNINPQNIIADPTLDTTVEDPSSKLIIPKINVESPILLGVGTDHDSQMKAMENGVAQFAIPGANANPGEAGNFVVSGHSSNDAFAPGDYKFIFAQNEKLTQGDTIYVNHQNTRYTYSITDMKVVLPSEVSAVQIATDKPMLTLISCVPLGTADKRLLIFAEQVSPSPNQASQSEQPSAEPIEQPDANIPGSPSPTFFERLFGA
ncbi:sortase [Candidatus Saccharibacteria bacterium]|nr:sortase [Candidatus Saccharibacteria bacterium]